MKRFYFLSVLMLGLGVAILLSFDASATPPIFPKKIVNSGNAKAVGGNGGNASGKGSQGGNGGSAAAKGGSILKGSSIFDASKIINSGNAEAKGGSGGSAKGKGSKGGNGGDATAVGGDIGTKPFKDVLVPIDPKTGKKIIPIDPGIGNGKGADKGTKAGGGGGGQASAGDANAKGGNGGNANGKGAKGGNGGDAIAVSGNGNTIINGDNNTIIGKVVNNNISINVGGGGFGGGGFGGGFVTGGAIAVGGAGGDGFIPGTPGTAIATSPSETVITNDGSPAIANGGNGQDNVEDGEKEQVFTRRFLKVKNDTDAPMKVFVQYRGMVDKKWAWVPADPNEAQDALVYDLKAGEEMYLQHNGSKLSASRVRIWGVAESQTWFDFRDQDLWVVPEMDQAGQHRYLATEMRTFTFVFPKKTESKETK